MRKNFFRILSAALILALAMSALPIRHAYAASFVVNTLLDENDWECSVDCSLRDAISIANWNGVSDSITFSVSGSITLLLGSLWVGNDSGTTIDGGNSITIVASGSSSAFQFASGSNALKNITVQGNAGSGAPLIDILNNNITIENVTVQNNTNGPGIQFRNLVTSGTVTNSTVQNNGGNGILIYDATGITIQNSRIESNGLAGIAISGSTLPITSNVQIIGNTIISNNNEGISLWGSNGNTIQNNYIGTDSSSAGPDSDLFSAILGNGSSGIVIANGSSNNLIENNRIAYNRYQNILIDGNGSSNNVIRNNHIYSGACQTASNENTGIIIINQAKNNTIGPGNRIECHKFDGIQVVGTGTDQNVIEDNNSTYIGFGGLSSSIRRNGRGISVINDYTNNPFPAYDSSNPPGPDNTIIRRNDIEMNNYDGIYIVLSTNTTIGGSSSTQGNNIRNNTGNGILIVGTSGTSQYNQITNNGGDGARIEPHYGLDRDPVNYSDDTVSAFDILNNNFANNGGAGIHGLDVDFDGDPNTLNANNIFSNNGRARIVQEWFGAAEVLDITNNPITSLTSGSIRSSVCGTTYSLQTYNSGAWGPLDNGLGNGSFNLNNIGTWFLIIGDYVGNSGNYVNCNPYTINATQGPLAGTATFSFDGNASTHPILPDPGIPYSRPIAAQNARYQVAQLTLRPVPTPTPSPSGPLPSTGFPQGRLTWLLPQPVTKAYVSYRDLILEIPSLGIKAPIVGVPKSDHNWDVSWLGKNVGWLEGSAFPTWRGNTVLTGHVWNADNTPGIFAQIKNLKYGDRLSIHAFGQEYIYEVRENTWLLNSSSNLSKVFKHEEKDWVTLLTCEGYNPLTGNYLFRRIVRAVLIEVK